MEIRITSRHPDGSEDQKAHQRFVLMTDEPVVISKSISIAGHPTVLQQSTFPYIPIDICEEFLGLVGKRVSVRGELQQPSDWFFQKEIQLSASDVLECRTGDSFRNILLYEPHRVTLKGKIYEKIYPGPPEYSSIEEGDAKETVWILSVKEPFDVKSEKPLEDDWNEEEKGVREVHVIFLNEWPPSSFLNRDVVLKGSLFHSHTAHHRRRVLMMVDHMASEERGK